MGRRGPAPKPTVLVLMEGNRGKRPINKREPKPDEFRHKPPEHLDAQAKKEWNRLVPILTRMKVLTEALLDIYSGSGTVGFRASGAADLPRVRFPDFTRSR